VPKRTIEVGYSTGAGADVRERIEVELPAGEARPWDAATKLRVVGQKVPRIDGALKVSGRAKYTFDVALPGMLHAAVLRSPHPCAKVKRIDVRGAEKRPGVRAVIALVQAGDRVLFAGQDVAAVAAERPELARDALAAITVEYDPEPFVVDTMSAAAEGAAVVHAGRVAERRTEGDEPGGAGGGSARGNVRPLPPMRRGDVAKALKKAAMVHEATYVTQVQTHAALETHGIVVRWDGRDEMTVWCSTQSIFSVRDEMAEIFGLERPKVHVVTEYLGGGFGAKFGASAPGSRLGSIAGELAKKAGAPVKLMCDRHEEHVCTGNRPDAHQSVTLAADGSKRLLAIKIVAHGTAGIGTGAGVGRNAFGVYTRCPNVLVEANDVFTHAGPGTAMRAPGHPQGAFAIELAIDELAAKLGVDPLKLRIDHDEHPLRRRQFELGGERFGWAKLRARAAELRRKNARVRRGVGVAASIWGDFGRAKAAVARCTIMRDGTIKIENGVQDIGGGIPTVIAQIGAEVFHRPVEAITVDWGTSELGPSVGSGGSQTTSSVTPAVRNACEQAKRELTELAAKLLGAASPEAVEWDEHATATLASPAGGGGKSITFAQLCKKIDGEAIVATASRPGSYGAWPAKFMGEPIYQIAGVQLAEVEVDTWTGVVRARRVLALHDCGRVMNELTVRSQIIGGVILGTSYALMEERVMDPDYGRMLNPNLESYKIAGARDVPDIDIVLTEVHTGSNNTGAVGIGEPATIPTAAAIACAVYDALGVPVRSLPITPAKVLAALGVVPGSEPT
jgi:xanthine dehydrogenase YagR molybdenum-binding subunit